MSDQTQITNPGPGHNASEDRLVSIVDRIERLEEERKSLSNDIKDIMVEAKGAGYDVKVLRQVLRLRRMDSEDLANEDALLDLYRRALGM